MNWHLACIIFSSSTLWSFSSSYVLVREIFRWVGSSSTPYSPRREIYSRSCYGRCIACYCFRDSQGYNAITRTTLTIGASECTSCNSTKYNAPSDLCAVLPTGSISIVKSNRVQFCSFMEHRCCVEPFQWDSRLICSWCFSSFFGPTIKRFMNLYLQSSNMACKVIY